MRTTKIRDAEHLTGTSCLKLAPGRAISRPQPWLKLSLAASTFVLLTAAASVAMAQESDDD
ncbi:hypothetical protein, partial [Salinicola rhizosphaerae]|uniref:hypothetical protein n=1 Tax=Salinicola rhizosphaerae TaxID=1443141 RepID=UPI001673A810